MYRRKQDNKEEVRKSVEEEGMSAAAPREREVQKHKTKLQRHTSMQLGLM
jgi:hypothetical protein